LGSSANTEAFRLELQKGFVVSDVFNRNGQIRFLQRESNGKVLVEFIADRKSLEANEFWIQSKRNVTSNATAPIAESAATSAGTWQMIPWLALPSSFSTDQNIEIAASERTAIQLADSNGSVLVGKGVNQAVANLAITALDARDQSDRASMLRIIVRNKPLLGELVLSASPNAKEIVLQGHIKQDVESRPAFILQIPAVLKERLQSDLKLQTIPCPDSTLGWVQVMMPNRTPMQPELESFSIRLSLPSEAPFEAWEMLSKIRTLSADEIVVFAAASAELLAQKPRDWEIVSDMERQRLLDSFTIDPLDAILETRNQFPDTQSELARAEDGIGPLRIRQALYSLFSATVPGKPDDVATLLESRLWIAGDAMPRSKNTKLEWVFDGKTNPVSVCVDGRPLAYELDGNRLRCEFHHAGLCAEVVLTTSHERNPADESRIDAPQLQSAAVESKILLSNSANRRLHLQGEEIPSETKDAAIASLARTCLQLFSDSVRQQHATVTATRVGSAWNSWQQYWNQRVSDYLHAWAHEPNSIRKRDSGADFGETVLAWHELRKKYRFQSNVFSPSQQPAQTLSSLEPRADLVSMWTRQLEDPRRWMSMLSCLLIVTFVTSMQDWFVKLRERRPWWCLMALGAGAWGITGSAIPFLVLGAIGMVVMIDSYWIFTERLRRIGLLGPRSL
jgi:hypothetical protein